MVFRIGHGYDAHRFAEGRKLFLGGVEIPFEKGLEGHSDADVLLHAACDALLGAGALGDIGARFPDSDPQYKDISSLVLLEKVAELLFQKGFSVVNIDITLIAQEPKISKYIPDMVTKIADALRLPRNRVNIKATTEERMGFTGSMEGMCCHAVTLLQR